MKICIVSDTHDNYAPLERAANEAFEAGAEAIVHCGDVVAPSTLKVLQRFKLPVHVIHGNNAGDLVNMSRLASHSDNAITYYGQDAGIELGGKNIFIVHYPHYAEALALTGDWDLVCCGHSHKPLIKHVDTIRGGKTLLVNPGTTGGVGTDPATYVLGDLETMEFHIHTIET